MGYQGPRLPAGLSESQAHSSVQQQHCGRPVGGRFQDQDRDSWEGMKLGQFEGTDKKRHRGGQMGRLLW